MKQLPMLYSEEDYDMLCEYNWVISQKGYAVCYTLGTTVIAHRLITNCPKGFQVDHINGCRLDNRKENLRVVTSKQNNMNRSMRKDNTSGYKGVTYKTRDKKYAAQIKLNGKLISLGYYHTAHDAHLAYEKKAKELFGEYYRLV